MIKHEDMKTYKSLVTIILLTLPFSLFSQDNDESALEIRSDIKSFTVSAGYGLNYGGYGLGFLYYPNQLLGVYANVGFPHSNLSYEFGAKIRPLYKHTKHFHPYILGQYGTNAAVFVLNRGELDRLFNGFTLGLGLDWSLKFMRPAYFSVGLLFPIRNSDSVNEYIQVLRKRYLIEQETDMLPVDFSIGLNFPF